MLRHFSRLPLLLVVLLVGLMQVSAQAAKPAAGKWEPITGTLKGVQGNVLLVEAASGEKWKISVAPEKPIDVSYTGTAEASYLHPGLPVKFTAKLNGKLVGQEPVSEIAVFSGTEFGIQEEGAGAADLLGGGEPGKKTAPKKPAPVDPNAINTYNVQGLLKSVKAGKMMVSAGNKTLTCDLADSATIKVDATGPAVLHFLQDGDSVEITKAMSEGPGLATAKDAKITGGKPLVGKTPKPLIASKPLTPEKPEAEKKPEETKTGEAKPEEKKPEEKKAEGDAKPGEAKPGFNANPLFNAK